MKKIEKIITSTAVLAVVAAAVTSMGNAFAATAPTWSGDSSTTIVRQIQKAYGKINNTFTYTIAPEATNPSGATGAPTSASIAFNNTYNTQTTASMTTAVDFSAMQFTQVGDYEYKITETASTNATIYPVDSANSYKTIISVRNNADLTGYVASIYMKDKNGDKINTFVGTNSEVVFASTPAYTNIQINETASGNSADPNKCFEYELTFNTTDTYVLSTSSTCSNPATVGNGSIISLKHGDTVTIGLNGTNSQIPVGTNYSVTKVDPSDGYTTSMDGTQRTDISKTMVATNASNFNTANVTSIDEHLDSTVPTNAFMNMAIYILLALVGIAGITYVAKRKSSHKA